jgi:DNA invertase Pin-like site-specific DNA recombinase
MTKIETWETRPKIRCGYPSKHPTELESEIEKQREELKLAGCTRFLDDEVTASNPRHGLKEAIGLCSSNGSTIVITTVDKCARSALEFFSLLNELADKKVPLEILKFGGRTIRSDSVGSLTLKEIAIAFRDFEQANQLHKQREGIVRAKNSGRYTGRHPSARLQKEDIWKRFVELRQPASQIAEALGISVPSVYRVAREVDSEKAQAKRQDNKGNA